MSTTDRERAERIWREDPGLEWTAKDYVLPALIRMARESDRRAKEGE